MIEDIPYDKTKPPPSCPHCRSKKTRWDGIGDIIICDDCGRVWVPKRATHRKADFRSGRRINTYYCARCKAAGRKHRVVSKPHGQTDRSSTWGSGVPTTRRECTGCHEWDGPWVSSELVGGGY
jgi:hypothetical protein